MPNLVDPLRAPVQAIGQRSRAWGRGGDHRWPAGHGPRNAWVRRLWTTRKKRTAPSVLVPTAQELRASGSGRHDAERPAMAQDDEPRQSGGGQLQQRRAPRERESVLYGLTVVRSDRLDHRCANTQAGARGAAQTRQALALEPLRTPRTHSIVSAGGSCAICAT
jgi:hypothetical protein